jgi:hypothetical protein
LNPASEKILWKTCGRLRIFPDPASPTAQALVATQLASP